ncbi:hypothetical protein GCM10007298_12280 [Williamsia phyllosphaerae]|uniref:Uncharacterized protein n=1 Tax=Williamsia phyllosphaerae TaxID=885042 RepID=A0ABQ1UFD8_9NOCA|nr:hypothetical protein GCM10007298_12280 [Williamsia phyllosphaerae]
MLIVATLFAGGLTWLVADDGSAAATSLIRLPSGAESFVASDSGVITQTAGTPVFDTRIGTASVLEKRSTSFPTFSQISFACAAVLVFAALGEAILMRRQPRKLVTIAIPFLVLAILWYATPGARSSVRLDPEVAFLFVLAAIAVREIWFRRFAPTLAVAQDEAATDDP